MKRTLILTLIIALIFTLYPLTAIAENIIYTVKTGDSLWKIAQAFDLPLEKIMETNNIENASLIYVGQQLTMAVSESSNNQEYSRYITYTINPGDILWNIAHYHGTTVEKLIELNYIKDAHDLYIGRQLLIPVTTRNYRPQSYLNNYYRVRTDETLSEIVEYYGLSEQELRYLNHLDTDDNVYTGQRLRMPLNPALSDRHQFYRVNDPQGEYLFDIAYYKGVSIKSILKANYLRDPNQKFAPGEVLLISLTPESRVTWIDYEDGKPVNSWFNM